jgi:DNA-binding transcriptional LysR family regulator
MELELLKTFLEVRKTQHFGKAARNLNVTQAAISVRIKQLENMMDTPLFVRFRNNLQLTDAGEKLAHHAENILHQWENARQEIGMRKSGRKTIRFGATNGFCEILLKHTLAPIYKAVDNLSLRVEAHAEENLKNRLREKKIDLALLYEPSKNMDFISRPVSSVELVLVSTTPDLTLEDARLLDYVSVEWGSFFNSRFLQLSSQMPNPVLQASESGFALQFLLDQGGVAFLPYRLVEDFLGKSLFRIEEVDILNQPIYAIYNRSSPYAAEMGVIVEVIAANVTPKFGKLEDMLKSIQFEAGISLVKPAGVLNN